MSLALVDAVQSLLDTGRFGRAMRGFEEIGSTNTEAAAWARDGAAEGSVVVAEYQTHGRGRHGRAWDADSGHNLTFSVVLRPTLASDRLGLVTVAAGVAVAEAVDAFVEPHRAAIKWPNDVLLEGRKTCGMLLESSFAGRGAARGAPEFVILGVGLNVNQTAFPDALADTATSLRLASGRAVPRPPLFARILHRLERRYGALVADPVDAPPTSGTPSDAAPDADSDARPEAEPTVDALRDAFHARMHNRGAETTLRFPGTDRQLSGTVRGIGDDGALHVDTGDGVEVLYAGEVTTRASGDA